MAGEQRPGDGDALALAAAAGGNRGPGSTSGNSAMTASISAALRTGA